GNNPGGVSGLITVGELEDRGSYAHLDPLLLSQAQMNADITEYYDEWKANYLQTPSQQYINDNGGGTMYFITGFDQSFAGVPNGAVSEGLGYGLVITALMNDQEAFDGIWRFTETKLNQFGVIEWLYDQNGYTVQNFGGGSGAVNATDGDLDAAYGLLIAAVRWGQDYADDADELIDNILEVNVTPDNFLNSGSDGYINGVATVNRDLVTSYLSPGYFRMFADFTGETRWDAVADQAVTQLRNNQIDIRDNYGNNGDWNRGGSGLFSFRTETNGEVSGEPGAAIWNSDVGRMMWRISTDAAWYGTGTSFDMMESFNNFARRQPIGDFNERYTLDGARNGGWRNSDAGWNAMSIADSLMISTSQSERDAGWNIVKTAFDESYYNGSLKLLGMMMAGGWYKNPVDIGGNLMAGPSGLTGQNGEAVDASAITTGEVLPASEGAFSTTPLVDAGPAALISLFADASRDDDATEDAVLVR
ncbi:MAG: glycosyl hydrolase family 8, partial [Planctomycetota bacterium]